VADFEERLKARLFRITCPSSVELGEYHLNLVPANRKLVIAQHLRSCPHCTRELAQLQEFLSVDAGEGLLQQARVIIARLVGPATQLAPAAISLRGEAQGPITLEADGIVIVLELQPAGSGTLNILGQLAADNQDAWTGSKVKLSQAGKLEFSTEVDDLGAFRCEGIAAGSKALRVIRPDESVIVVSELEISP
jgi:hypothetical protein